MKEKISNNIQIKNKRATFDYELLDTFREGEFGRYVLYRGKRGTVGEEYVHRRIFLRYVQ